MSRTKFLTKILFFFFAILSFSLAIVSCNDDEEENNSYILQELTSNAWHLQKFKEGDSVIYPKYENGYENNKLYTMIFYDDSFTMKANPNWYDGTFTLNEQTNNIKINIVFSSQAMSTEHEKKMIEALNRTSKISIASNKLCLYYDTNKYMEFEKVNLNVWNSKK